MRKHLYLITNHPDEELIGNVEIAEKSHPTVEKNEAGIIRMRNMDSGEVQRIRAVGMGYHDFDGPEDFDDRIGDVIRSKLFDVDREYKEAAGLMEEEPPEL